MTGDRRDAQPDGARPGDPHPGDRLSALLDGELEPDAALAVRHHLLVCPPCAAELAAARAGRRLIRSLPGVEPPVPASLPRGPHRRTAGRVPRRRRVAVVELAGAAVLAVVLTTTGALGPERVVPELRGAVSTHAAAMLAVSGGEGATGRATTPSTDPPRDPSGLSAPYLAPERLAGGYRLVKAFASPHGLHLVYRRGRHGLSVFEAPGTVDPAALPPGAREVDLAGWAGWQWRDRDADGRIVVLERAGLVITLVGDEPGDAVLQAARSLPGPRSLSFTQRVRQAVEASLDALAPVG